jgi:hypothetical protein
MSSAVEGEWASGFGEQLAAAEFRLWVLASQPDGFDAADATTVYQRFGCVRTGSECPLQRSATCLGFDRLWAASGPAAFRPSRVNRPPATGHGPNLCRYAVPVGQAPDVGSWQHLPFDTSLVNGRNVPNIALCCGPMCRRRPAQSILTYVRFPATLIAP